MMVNTDEPLSLTESLKQLAHWFDLEDMEHNAALVREAAIALRQAHNDALEEAIDICNQEATIEGIAQKCAARIEALKSKETP